LYQTILFLILASPFFQCRGKESKGYPGYPEGARNKAGVARLLGTGNQATRIPGRK